MRIARTLLLAAACAPAAGIAAAQGPAFTDAAAQAGFAYVQHDLREAPDCLLGGVDGNFCEPERMTGAIAIGDCNGDGLDDVFVTRVHNPNILFRNMGGGVYADVTAQSGLALDINSNGAGWIDIDNDGDIDLYVNTIAESRNYLFVNNGFGVFAEQAIERGAAIESAILHTGWSVNFGDYDRDGWADIHTVEWIGGEGISNGRLLRNRGPEMPGHFEDVTIAAGVQLRTPSADVLSWGFSSAFADMDNDGWQDLAISGDFGHSRLHWNNGDGTFTDGTTDAGVGTEQNGMGSTIGDYDNDGLFDWFVTAILDPDETCDTMFCGWGYLGNRLHRNEGNRVFSDRTDQSGVRNGHWGWGASFFDYDNDGDLDLVMTNGFSIPAADVDAAYNFDPMRFWRNDGALVMTEISGDIGIVDTGSGKGLVTFDYEEDGDLDIMVANNGAAPVLYRNDGANAGDFVRVRVRGTTSNRDGFGARVHFRATADGPTQMREIGVGTHFLGQSERVAHFGAGEGSDPFAEVRVEWPATGRVNVFANVPRNTSLLAIEPAS